jgi:hypothetical protein
MKAGDEIRTRDVQLGKLLIFDFMAFYHPPELAEFHHDNPMITGYSSIVNPYHSELSNVKQTREIGRFWGSLWGTLWGTFPPRFLSNLRLSRKPTWGSFPDCISNPTTQPHHHNPPDGMLANRHDPF